MINKVTKAAALITFGIISSKIFGFLREMSIATGFGATMQADSYFLAMMIPMILFSTVSNSITTTFIPIFTQIMKTEDKKRALNFSNNIINAMIIFSSIISLLGIIFGRQIVQFVALGYKGPALELTIFLTQIMFPMIIFLSMSGVLGGFLNSHQKFFIPAISWIPQNLIVIGYCLLLSRQFGIVGLAVATVIGSFVQVLIQAPQAYKMGYRYQFVLNLSDDYLKKVFKLIGPVVIGVGLAQINTLIDRMLASSLSSGSISALNYANKMCLLPLGVFVFAIVTAIFPQMSELFVQNKLEEIKGFTVKAIKVVTILILPITVGFMMIRVPLIRMLFERGQFDTRGTMLTAQALLFYSLGLIGFAVRDVLNRTFYALQDTLTPMRNGILAVLLNIVLNLILVKPMAHAGLALATSISSISTAILLYYSLSKKIGGLKTKEILMYFIKISIISLMMGVVVWFLLGVLKGQNSLVIVAITGIVGMVVYVLFLKLAKVEELEWVLEIMRAKAGKFNRRSNISQN